MLDFIAWKNSLIFCSAYFLEEEYSTINLQYQDGDTPCNSYWSKKIIFNNERSHFFSGRKLFIQISQMHFLDLVFFKYMHGKHNSN